VPEDARNCSRCAELLPPEAFYFISRKLGKRRGQCKACMAEVKQAQRDPDWLPTCVRCGQTRPRVGPGRRLCAPCFADVYDAEDRRANGSHRLRLNDCPACGAHRLRADHVSGTMLCPTCRSVPQSRRKNLKAYFGLTPREYLEMLAAQRDRCAICGSRSTASLHVDHRHAEPAILRGALCNTCNTMIGLARDDPDRLRRAAAYLEYPPAQVLFPGRTATPDGNRRSWNRLTRVAS
jgi:Recombination endonuclease VII